MYVVAITLHFTNGSHYYLTLLAHPVGLHLTCDSGC